MSVSSGRDLLVLLRDRGFIQQVSDEAGLAAALGEGPLTYYVGFDPSAASLHLGHAIPIMAMAHLARAGHRPIGVLGGGTMMVGDPSGRSELRKMLTPDQIAANRACIEPQVRRFLADAGERAVFVDNGDWLLPLNYIAFLRDIGVHFSVNRMLAAEAYRQRLEKGLSFIEFNYQLLQAYDFLVLYQRHGCRLQIGGDDQWGNILAGVDLIRRVAGGEAWALTAPLITTSSGAKMGKTAAGAVWLDARLTSPFDFFQYFVNVDDRDVERFLKLLTFVPTDEIRRLGTLAGAEVREAKTILATEATALVHGRDVAERERAAARAAFGGGGDEAAIPTLVLPSAKLGAGGGLRVVDVLVEAGLAASKGAARRLIEQAGVRLGDARVTAIDALLTAAEVGPDGVLLHVGKKHLRRLIRGA